MVRCSVCPTCRDARDCRDGSACQTSTPPPDNDITPRWGRQRLHKSALPLCATRHHHHRTKTQPQTSTTVAVQFGRCCEPCCERPVGSRGSRQQFRAAPAGWPGAAGTISPFPEGDPCSLPGTQPASVVPKLCLKPRHATYWRCQSCTACGDAVPDHPPVLLRLRRGRRGNSASGCWG